MNAHDIITILPKFDPLKKDLGSAQFLSRVEPLRHVYGWDDKLFLFASQANLEGVAKTWINGYLEVYVSWARFANELLLQFPTVTVAEIHMQLMQTRRNSEEDINAYYYRLVARARRSNIDDQSIIKYVINGVNDIEMKRCLSVRDYQTSQELLI